MQLIDQVYDELKERIFQAKYKPNQLITEREICEQFQVSKVTAGEALHRLCHEGHLIAYPRSGYMVRTLTPREMIQIKRMRVALESLVMEVLCQEGDDGEIRELYQLIIDDPEKAENASAANRRFHMGMAERTHDPYLISAMQNLLGAASRVEQYVGQDNQLSWQDCHRDIVDALVARDEKRAREKLMMDIHQR